MAKPTLDRKRALVWRVLFTVILLTAAVYLLNHRWTTVGASLRVARGASLEWLLCSLAAMAVTFCIAAAIYHVLALHRLHYRETLLIELAGAFVNRLLPAGLGGLGLNGAYLYRRRHTPAEATVVVSVNNLVGMAAHLALLAALFAVRPEIIRSLFVRHQWNAPWKWGLVGLLALCLVLRIPAIRRPLTGLARHLLESVRRLSPRSLALALVLSVLLTATYTLILYSVVRAIGNSLGLLSVFVVFSFGMLVGTATPTPGGLVGTEAGLFAGFVAFGFSQAEAGAAVLLFRLNTYWLPLVPGAAALWASRARLLV